MTKSFLVLAAIFVLVGGGIGGAFVGGIIVGENRAERDAPVTGQFTQPGSQAAVFRQFSEQIPLDDEGNPDLAALSRMTQAQGSGLPTPPGRTPTASADANSETPASTDDGSEATDVQSAFPGFGRGLGAFGGGAAFGTIEAISDGVIVISTSQGTVEVAINPETAIQVFSTGEPGDLEEGMSITAMGEFDVQLGKLDAASIIAAPEGPGAFPGLGGGFQNRGQDSRRP